MLDLSLEQQIQTFVSRFMVVEEWQVRKFFSDWGEKKVNHDINLLKRRCLLFEHKLNWDDENEPVKLATARRLPSRLENYRRHILAVSVLTKYESKEINFFERMAFPSEITFITEDDVVYDISVFDTSNWAAKLGLTVQARRSRLPDPENDPTNYIAVVPYGHIVVQDGKAIIPPGSLVHQIKGLGFAMYATIDRNGNPEMFNL